MDPFTTAAITSAALGQVATVPSAARAYPGWRGAHDEAPAGERVPGAQGEQASALPMENVPLGHTAHVSTVMFRNVPGVGQLEVHESAHPGDAGSPPAHVGHAVNPVSVSDAT